MQPGDLWGDEKVQLQPWGEQPRQDCHTQVAYWDSNTQFLQYDLSKQGLALKNPPKKTPKNPPKKTTKNGFFGFFKIFNFLWK